MRTLYNLFIGATCVSVASGRSFLTNSKDGSTMSARRSASALQGEVGQAMEEAMGCGGLVDPEHLLVLEGALRPLWRTLPKNAQGNVDRKSLRYAIHRYFNRRWAIHIRGFEPSRPANASTWGDDDILGQRVPAFVEGVLASRHRDVQGFTLGDAASMVATIEQLIFDWEGSLLEEVYAGQGVTTSYSLGFYGMVRMLTAYVIQWLMRVDADTTATYIANQTLLEAVVPTWPQVSSFIRGRVKAHEVRRRVEPRVASRDGIARRGHNAMVSKFSFEDAHTMIGEIRRSFASFWDSECASMKAQLFGMDAHRTGRVALSTFYGTGLEEDWRFGESEDYLRKLGVLDETSWRGKQVIVSNYMQAASNCVVSTPHYLVCCHSDCEGLLEEIEAAVGAPTAEPARLLEVVTDLMPQSALDDDSPTTLSGSLRRQLLQIATANNGVVPLHGRLFAQWLHYVFPRECAFPHKAGVAASIAPHEYGEYYATDVEMMSHTEGANTSAAAVTKDDAEWMAQWSPEEELVAEHAWQERGFSFAAPWEARRSGTTQVVGMLSLVGLCAALVASRLRSSAGTSRSAGVDAASAFLTTKQHYV